MNQVGAWIRERPVVSFYIITFAVSWGLGFSTVAVLKNEQFLLMPLAVLAFCAPALAGIIVTAVEGGQARPAFGRNRRRWIVFIVAMFAGTAIWLAHNHFLNTASITPVVAVFGFFFLTPPVAFIISAAFSRGTAVRGMMTSLLRLRGVGGWVVLALVFIPALFIISAAASDLIERRPVLAASDAVLGAPLLGMIVLKFLYQMFFSTPPAKNPAGAVLPGPVCRRMSAPCLRRSLSPFSGCPGTSSTGMRKAGMFLRPPSGLNSTPLISWPRSS